ncbi:DNA polymerase III, alpha subunit, Gram-positive type [Mycoplasmopsis alligatoris A21JP2]|uniref:DNA polymerase III PolC-type n=2 Tax=Mycoplasmopsis alligatoris TaxID=47687 RepID=D4XWF0_9BACT|nr:DNA polymerase III, alpha subunit, Gram-positive type [Mycoplasmopsis alligatoris A21JP2]
MEFLQLPKLNSLRESFISKDITYSVVDGNYFFDVSITFVKLPNIREFDLLIKKIRNNNTHTFNVDFTIINNINDNLHVKQYLYYIADNNLTLSWIKDSFFEHNLTSNKTNTHWLISYTNINDSEKIAQACSIFNQEMSWMGFKDFKISPLLKEYTVSKTQTSIDYQEALRKKIEIENNEALNAAKKSLNRKLRYSKSANYLKQTISEINADELDEKSRICFEGVVYKSAYSLAKNSQKHMYVYNITDYADAIEVKLFLEQPLEGNNLINDNDYVIVEGSIAKNNRNVIFIWANSITKTENKFESVLDDALTKRIEFNTKSKMNSMDGILNPAQIIKKAKELNHKAVALLDSNSVQGFPEFYSSALKQGIKPILGTTFSAINKSHQAVLNYQHDQVLKQADYISFDIETTGLSPRYHEIIEFGASIIKNGSIVAREQFFIKASKPLSSFTTNLTGITDKMLQEEGIELKTALERILKLFENKIALAHNAQFDMNFVFQKLLDNCYAIPSISFVDTLMISRIIFPNKSKHRLGDYTSNLGINYSVDDAHRADYDAEILAQAWIASISHLAQLNLNNLSDLHNYQNSNLHAKKFSNEVSIIAKNQIGLKKLFKLVTKTLTERFFDSPKLFLEDLEKDQDLLVGSAGLNGFLLNTLFYKSDLVLREYIKLYDYVEIPSISNFKHWIEYEDFTLEQIQDGLRYLINLALEHSKIVIAVGDVRYIDKPGKAAYDLLIYAKAIGGDRHYLYEYRRRHNLKTPERFFLTTEQMLEEFEFLGKELAYKIVVQNTNLIADSIDNIEVIKKDLYTPKFDDSHEKLKDLVYKTAHKKYGEVLPEIIENRIKKEIDPILKYGYDVIYWISHKLVKKSVENGYLVGSRGSVGSSLVATLSGITEVNPLPPHYICQNCKYFELVESPITTSGFDLDDKNCPKCNSILDKDGQTIPFETFLGFKADKVPDIDLNFSGEYQAQIHNEVKRLFGQNHTFRAGTISTAAYKTSFGYIKNAIDENGKHISDNFVDYLTTQIEGVKRTTGQHPGGILIIPKEFDVEDFCPINFPADDTSSDWKTTHFDFRAIHDNVLKLDLLGHDDPTAIRMLEKLTGLNVKKDIPKKDEKVMSIFKSPKALGIEPSQIGNEQTGALGIPEFGTPFVRKMLEQSKPQHFSDLISLSGLSHGTDVWLNNAQSLIMNEGLTIDKVISCRDDIMVYLIQNGVESLDAFKIMEQVRKGQGIKPDQEEMLKKIGIKNWYIESMKKIKYMFPKAHATAYVLMAWRIAWFKVYKPLEYYATYFTTRCDVFDIESMANDVNLAKINNKISEINNKSNNERSVKENNLIPVLEIARELYARGFSISSISVHESLENEWIINREKKCLIPSFSTMDGLGINIAETITAARKERPFTSKEDFFKRTSITKTQFNEFEKLGIFGDLPDSEQNTLF